MFSRLIIKGDENGVVEFIEWAEADEMDWFVTWIWWKHTKMARFWVIEEGLLLGTRFTMEESFNKERFYKNGVNIIIPSLEERQLVHDIIFAELCRGIITNNSKEQYKKIIYKYCKGKETGVILGCTEIGLLIQQNFMDVPIFDTTQIHAKKIAMYMIE